MKNLVITTAIVCLSTASAFAAGKPTGSIKTETRIKTEGTKIGQEKLGSTETTVRTNMGSGARVGSEEVVRDNILTQTTAAVLAKSKQPGCNMSLTTAAKGVLAQAVARGLSQTKCVEDKFAGDSVVQDTAQEIIAANNQVFTNLGVKDVNGDGKTTVADLADREKAVILKTGGAAALGAKIKIDTSAALDRLEGTVTNEEPCDIITKELGTRGAFNAARSL